MTSYEHNKLYRYDATSQTFDVVSKTFIVGHINWYDHKLVLECIVASSWQHAVVQHSHYPFKDSETDAPNAVLVDEEKFKQECFDCDCMMSWIEVT